MRLRTVDQIKKLIETKKAEIKALEVDLQIAVKRVEISELEKSKKSITKPKRKYTRRKNKATDKKSDKKPQADHILANPAPQQATGGQKENEVKYCCLNPACKSKGKPIPASEIKNWDDTSGKKEPQCPYCFKWDVIVDEV